MKVSTTILVFMIGFHLNSDAQLSTAIVDSILADTIGMDEFYKEKTIEYVGMIRKDMNNKSKVYPFQEYKSVFCYEVNERFHSNGEAEYGHLVDNKTQQLGTTVTTPGIALNSQQVKGLLHLLNNPLSYQWGACGTPIPKVGFVFYSEKNEIVASIDFGCRGYSQINSINPDSYLIREGSLTKNATTELKELLAEIGVIQR